MEDFKIAEEVAITELKSFIEYHLDETIDADQVKKDYWDVVKAVMRANLDISNPDQPVLTLQKPIKREGGAIELDKITFRTRITKSQLAVLSKGADLQKDALTFANKMTAYFIQQDSVPMLDLYGKHDMRVIDQLVGLFQ